jgi:hypothetical protein
MQTAQKNKNTIKAKHKNIIKTERLKQKYKIFLFYITVFLKLSCHSLNIWCVDRLMSRPDYPAFSKRIHREQREERNKRGGYNFEKTKEYTLAEKWFEERKALKKEPIPVPTPKVALSKKAPPGLVQQEPVQKQVPVLKRQRSDSCDLELKIPSYADFNYIDPDEIVAPPQITFDLSDIFGEVQYSTPVIEESFSDEDSVPYEGQLSEIEAHEALQASLALQEMHNQLVAYQVCSLLMLMANTANM